VCRLDVVGIEHDEHAIAGGGDRGFGVETAIDDGAGERDVVGTVVLETPAEGLAVKGLGGFNVVERQFDLLDGVMACRRQGLEQAVRRRFSCAWRSL
jgi:hypothetical protein